MQFWRLHLGLDRIGKLTTAGNNIRSNTNLAFLVLALCQVLYEVLSIFSFNPWNNSMTYRLLWSFWVYSTLFLLKITSMINSWTETQFRVCLGPKVMLLTPRWPWDWVLQARHGKKVAPPGADTVACLEHSEKPTSAHHVTCLTGNDVRASMGQNLNLRHPQGQAKRSGYYLALNWDQLWFGDLE